MQSRYTLGKCNQGIKFPLFSSYFSKTFSKHFHCRNYIVQDLSYNKSKHSARGAQVSSFTCSSSRQCLRSCFQYPSYSDTPTCQCVYIDKTHEILKITSQFYLPMRQNMSTTINAIQSQFAARKAEDIVSIHVDKSLS